MVSSFMLAMGVVASAGGLRTNSDREGWREWFRAGEEGGGLIAGLMLAQYYSSRAFVRCLV